MSQHKSLQDWISRATAGIPPSAAQKFSAEIADHAAESRRVHIDAGMSSEEADRAALAGLGDPGQVAARLRDVHFSRALYAWGQVLALFLTVVVGLGMVLMVLSVDYETELAHRLGDTVQWWGMIALASCALLLPFLGRALTVFLREQYDIIVGWAEQVLLWVPVFAAAVPILFVLVWARVTGQPTVKEALPAYFGSQSWVYLLESSVIPYMVGSALAGLALAGLCGLRLARRNVRAHRGLSLALGVGGLFGLVFAAEPGLLFANALLPYRVLERGARFVADHQLIYILPTFGLSLALLFIVSTMFGRMRRPGAVMAG